MKTAINFPLASKEEIKLLVANFLQTFDQNRDNYLDRSEVMQMFPKIYKGFQQDKGMEALYSIWDVNNDGKVDVSDIEAICRRYLLGENNFVAPPRQEKAKKKVYSRQAQQSLDVARRLFRQFDQDKTGTLELPEVKKLMAESYKSMGMEFNPSDEEAKSFMSLIDQNHDGLLHIEDYEVYVLKSLEEAGIKIEEDQIKL